MRLYELNELAGIYEERGLPKDLAKEVAKHLTKNDGAHVMVAQPTAVQVHHVMRVNFVCLTTL
jgi:hypothetical protein